MLDVDRIGDCEGILLGEPAVTVEQVLFDCRRHAHKAPGFINQAFGLTTTIKAVIFAETVRNTHAQRHFQPAIELQHHVHRLEAITNHHIKLLFAAKLVQRPHGAQAHALERFVTELEIHRMIGFAHWLAGAGAAAQKGCRDFIALAGQRPHDLFSEIGKVMGFDVVVRLQLQNLGTLHIYPC